MSLHFFVVRVYLFIIVFLLVLSDLTWIQVRSAEEAWRIVRAGRRNQSFASTHLNQNSSRRWDQFFLSDYIDFAWN